MKTILTHVVRAATLGWFAAHFALTLLWVMPVNPVKLATLPLLNAYIGTYFPQNWSLFAPNPLDSDHALLARCIHEDEHDLIARSGLPSDNWHDLSTPFWARFQENRFSAYDRLVRPQSSAIRTYANGSIPLVDWWTACDKGLEEACDVYDERLERARDEAGKLFTKVGSAFCADTATGGSPVTHVALRLRQSFAVPWSRRYEDESRVEDYELGVYPIDPSVERTGLYLVRSES